MVLKPKLKRVVVATACAITCGIACACVSFEDRCVDVRCDEGEICVDLEPAPTCVCDSEHEADEEGTCIPLGEDDGDGVAGSDG